MNRRYGIYTLGGLQAAERRSRLAEVVRQPPDQPGSDGLAERWARRVDAYERERIQCLLAAVLEGAEVADLYEIEIGFRAD